MLSNPAIVTKPKAKQNLILRDYTPSTATTISLWAYLFCNWSSQKYGFDIENYLSCSCCLLMDLQRRFHILLNPGVANRLQTSSWSSPFQRPGSCLGSNWQWKLKCYLKFWNRDFFFFLLIYYENLRHHIGKIWMWGVLCFCIQDMFIEKCTVTRKFTIIYTGETASKMPPNMES